jgi:hypothetical protein
MSYAQTAVAPRYAALKRAGLGLLALSMAANALFMLADPLGWYGAVDGVPDTGPFNPHFVRDIGVAYLTIAVLSGASALWLRQAFALMSGVTLFLGLHVLLHVWDIAAGRLSTHHLVIDLPGVLGPTLVAALLMFWVRHDRA